MTVTVAPGDLDLATFLRRGDRIVWGHACGEPTTLVEALIEQAPGIGELSAFTATSFSGILGPEAGERLNIHSMGAIGVLSKLTAVGKLSVIPCHVGQIGSMIGEGLIGCDVVFLQVSPPDNAGNHSFGLVTDYVEAAVAKARVVIAEVNEQTPFTLGAAMLPAAKIDYAVRVDRTPVELASGPIGEADLAIARHTAEFIADGAIIQVGIGAVPNAILRLLEDRRDLGFHSGMMSDGVVDLIEAGVITNALKPIDRGISITGALIGTRRLFNFAHRNPLVGMRNAIQTHGDAVLSSLPGLVTINSAVEVDLTGQVNAEQVGNQYIGGTGGQVDYVRAGGRSAGGRAVIALQATAKGRKFSRIVTNLSGPVTTARSEVDVIVTEFGSAELKGQTFAERARRLTAIAHPDFREALSRAAYDIQQRGF